MAYLPFSFFVGGFLWSILILPWWPWDFKGRRKTIKINRGRKDWDDYDDAK